MATLEQRLREFVGEMQHHGEATCFEFEGQEGTDPDNCQKCRLTQIINDHFTINSSDSCPKCGTRFEDVDTAVRCNGCDEFFCGPICFAQHSH